MAQRRRGRPPHQPQHQQPQQIDQPPEFSADLREFLEAVAPNHPALIHVYKIEKTAGRSKRSLVEELENVSPSYSEIGERYGGGDYEVIVNWKADPSKHVKAGMKSFRFNLHERWNDRMLEKRAERALANPVGAMQQDRREQVSDAVGLMSELVKIIQPLIPTPQQLAAPGAVANPMDTMQAMTQLTSTMLQENVRNQMATQKEVFNTMSEMRNGMFAEPQAPETQDPDRITQLLGALERFLPLFLKSPSAVQNEMVTEAKGDPQVQQVLSDPEQLEIFKARLRAKVGPEKAAKIISKFDSAGRTPKKRAPRVKAPPKKVARKKTTRKKAV